MSDDLVVRWGPDTVGLLTLGRREARRGDLHPAERELFDALPVARRTDFAVGRRAAGAALAALGRTGPVLRSGALPLFPAGVRGSLSHCAGRAGAALVSRDPAVAAVGVDVERVGRLSELGVRRALNRNEWQRLPPAQEARTAQATALFSAKESLFKAATALVPGGRAPDIGTMDVDVAGDGSLHLGFGAHVPFPAHVFSGRLGRVGPYVVTFVVAVRRPGAQPRKSPT